MQITTSSTTSGSITTVNTAITQTSQNINPSSTVQSYSTITTITIPTNITLRNLPLPIENLLNIKYEMTTTHNWYFSASLTMINDSGCPDNFLNYHLQSRWPDNLAIFFPTNASTHYFTPVGVNYKLLPGISFDVGLFNQDTSSIILQSAGPCFQLFNIATDHIYNQVCLSQPENCEYGFSVALWVKFMSGTIQNKDYLLTSGPDGVQGFKFYHKLGQLYVEIIGQNNLWTANMPFTKSFGTWSIVGFSWRRYTGEIRLLVGDQFVVFINTQTVTNLNLAPSKTIYLGCLKDLSGYTDHTTSSYMSVAHIGLWLWPVREKALLTGSFVYKMIKPVAATTPPTTTAPLVAFDYSKVINEVVGTTSDPNPFYSVADEYISLANTQITPGQVDISTDGRGGFRLNGKGSKIDISLQRTFANTCPKNLTICRSGLSLSMWLMIQNTTDNGDILEVVNNIRILFLNGVVNIIVYNGTNSFGRSTNQINFNIWQNLGLSFFFTTNSLKIYINGVEDTSTTVLNVADFVRGGSDIDVNNGDFVIGSGASNSLIGTQINDIVLWRRSLLSFESHRFVGYTYSQFNQLQNAVNYWTTDQYINRDSIFQINRKAFPIGSTQTNFSLSSVLKLISKTFAMDIDPFSKSKAQSPILEQLFTDYLILARSKLFGSYQDSDINWTGECMTDPCQDKCRNSGLTVSMWLKIKSVSLSKIRFYFNSGDMADYPGSIDARGFSFFTYQNLFGVSLSTCISDWNIIIDANKYSLNQWMNIGIIWREDLGLKLLINGVDYGLITNIPDQIYKPQDFGFRAVTGRYDIDDQTLWPIMGYWEMSNFVFGEMSYFSQSLTADQYASLLGMVNNVYYTSAVLLRQGMSLVNQPISDLLLAKNQSQSYNYQGVISWNSPLNAIQIISGRIPIMIDSNTCPTTLNNCVTGFSIGGWFFLTYNFTSSLKNSYNIISQGNMTTMGFGITINQNNSIYGWVQTNNLYSVTVQATSFYANLNQWIFLGLIWQKNIGMTLLINGKDYYSNSMVPVSVPAPTNKILFIGDLRVNAGSNNTFLVFNVVFYDYILNLVQFQKLLGIQYNQGLLLSKATFFWPTNGMYNYLIQQQIKTVSVTYTTNKYDIMNSATCTMGSDQSYILLQSQAQHCLQNPDLCTSFVLIANINFQLLIFPTQAAGFILTLGNNQTKVRGVSIIQTASNTIEFYVRNSTVTCKSVMLNFTVNSWVQIKLIWSSLKNPIVKVDENTKAAAVDAVCWTETNSLNPSSDIIIGRNPIQSATGAKVCISEVMLMQIMTPVDPDSESTGLFYSSCYQNMDLIYRLNGNENDQYQMPLSATKLSDAVISDVLPKSCLTNPSICSNGLTLSVWVSVSQITGTSASLISVGQTKRHGLSLTIISGANSSVFGITASLNTGTLMWVLEQDNILIQNQWTNIGLTWNFITGINLFINGLLAKSNTISTPITLQDNSLGTSIDIGKSITGYINNVVIWFKVVASCQNPQASNKQLTGICKADTMLPIQVKCSILANCNNTLGSLCIDETQGNVVQIANSGLKITSSSDANSILNVVNNVLKKTTPNANLTMASVSLLLNVATNMLVSGPLTAVAANSLIKYFVAVNAEIMLDKYANDWITMANLNLYNPLSVILSADSFYLNIAQQLTTTCSPLSAVQSILGVTLLKIDIRITGCSSIRVPNYLDSSWTQNTSIWQNAQDTLQLDNARIQENGPVISVASSLYNSRIIIPAQSSPSISQGPLLPLQVNSRIITINTFPAFPRSVNNTMVNVQLSLITPNVRPSKAQAWDVTDPSNTILTFQWFPAFWNASLIMGNSLFGTWDNTGCKPITWNTTNIFYKCDHMTSFTVIMETPPPNNNAYLMTVLSTLTTVGLIISILCLLIFIITIAVSKSLRGTRYIIHLNMGCSLLVASIAFILVEPAKQNQTFCQAVGIMMHMFFLASFGWIFIEALYVFYAVTSGKFDKRFNCFVPVAWGLPIVIVAAVAGLSLDSYGRNQFCWLTQNSFFVWTFLGPILLYIILTIILCLIVACNLSTPAVKGDDLDNVRDNIKQTAYTIPFMFLGWIFGVVYVTTSIIAIGFLFVILCSLQGLWVLIFFGLLNPDFRYALCRKSRRNETQESKVAILDGIETRSSSQSSIRKGNKNSEIPIQPTKPSAPVYYSSKPKSKPPRHVNSAETSRVSLNSERRLIRPEYHRNTYEDDLNTNTLQNNGIPDNYNRTIPGTSQYQE